MPALSGVAQRLLPFLVLGLFGCSGTSPASKDNAAPKPAAAATVPAPEILPPAPPFPVMLGIDTLEADGFAALKGKRVGLLTNQAGVNRRGESTVDVMRRATNFKLVALFSPEHGLYGTTPAGKDVPSSTDARTGLPVHSLYDAATRVPGKAVLKGIDAFVIDLQDIGVRSYTYNVCMKYAIEGCFANGVEVIVLDRPNPLGGLKVDGPSLDADLKSGVGQFRIPYVFGLTIGELARMAADAPGVLDIPDTVRARGKLTVIPMRGWKRSMRWPDTGLTFVPTSPNIRDFAAVVGYAMVGLGTTKWYPSGATFGSGIGTQYFDRAISFTGRNVDMMLQDLTALKIPGLAFRKVQGTDTQGKPASGVYVDIANWEEWRPTELSFQLMRLTCRLRGNNPFAAMTTTETLYYNKHVGSKEWTAALKRDGAKVDVEGFVKLWQARNEIYQQQTRKYWLYD